MSIYKIEIEEIRRGFVEVERDQGETIAHMRERAKEAVEDGVMLPVWEEDELEVSADPSDGLRCYDLDAPCRQKVGSLTRFCSTHDEPMVDGLDTCQRRVDDLVAQRDRSQEQLW